MGKTQKQEWCFSTQGECACPQTLGKVYRDLPLLHRGCHWQLAGCWLTVSRAQDSLPQKQ